MTRPSRSIPHSGVRVPARIAACCIAPGILLAGCYDTGFGHPEREVQETVVSQTIADLKNDYAGTPFTVTGNISVAGTVTSSDQAGNFYRTLCIQDLHAGMEIWTGIDQTHNEFPIGCRVTVRLEGLTVTCSRGVLQAGKAPHPGSGYEIDYIGSQAALGKVIVRNSETLQPLDPARMTIPELTPEHGGTLVRIDRLHYLPEDLSASDWNGYKRFADERGNTIRTYVSPYADFSAEEVPAGTVSLTGILQCEESGADRYILKLRDENDCSR